MSSRRRCSGLLGWAVWLVLSQMHSDAAGIPLHADAATLAPDGVRVAYLQNDGPIVRVVVANIEDPGRTMFFNLGESFTDSITIVWQSPRSIELRNGAKSFAHFIVDPTLAPDHESGLPVGVPDEVTVAEELRRKLPHRSVNIVNWDNKRQRVLVLALANSPRARYFVYDRRFDLLFEIARREAMYPPR